LSHQEHNERHGNTGTEGRENEEPRGGSPHRHHERGGRPGPHAGGPEHKHGRSYGERRGPRFERGDLRYVVLEQLAERPAHGYEVIRALEGRFHGFYSPSPGVVYPTLQWLEDLGYVTVAAADGRRIFTITEEGRTFLADGRARLAEIDERVAAWMGPMDHQEYRAVIEGIRQDLEGMSRALREILMDMARLRRMRAITQSAGQQIQRLLAEQQSENGEEQGHA
jgi:DNA-binding PadR family transcriptional regulator